MQFAESISDPGNVLFPGGQRIKIDAGHSLNMLLASLHPKVIF
jgi:hypothetical protein